MAEPSWYDFLIPSKETREAIPRWREIRPEKTKFKQKSNQAQNRDKFIQLEFEFILKYEGGLLLRHVLNPNNRWNNPAIKFVRLLVEPKHKQIQGQDGEK